MLALLASGCWLSHARPGDGADGGGDAPLPIDAPLRDVPAADVLAPLDVPSDTPLDVPPDAGEAPVEPFLRALLEAECARAVRCEAPYGRSDDWLGWPVASLCHPDGSGDAALVATDSYLRAARECESSQLDEALAARCLTGFDDACDVSGDVVDACRFAVRPMPAGSTCVPGDCGDDALCAPEREDCPSCPWHCAPRPRVGEPCSPHGDCAGEALCPDGVCTPTNASCEHHRSTCGAGYLCIGPSGDRRCRRAALAGEVCSSAQLCMSDALGCVYRSMCSAGLRCDDAVCVPLSQPGERCENTRFCPSTFVCDGRCVPQPTEGQPCDHYFPCVEGTCQDGRCRTVPAGEACLDGVLPLGTCEGRAPCIEGRCLAVLRLGEACDFRGSSYCEAGTTCDEASLRCAPIPPFCGD